MLLATLQQILHVNFEGFNEETTQRFVSGGEVASARATSVSFSRRGSNQTIPFTHLLMNWGQFTDHDLTLSPESGGEGGTEVDRYPLNKSTGTL